MAPPRSIAVAQTIPARGDANWNVGQHAELARAAAGAGAQVVVFPELSLTGYELDLAADLAFSERDARLAPLVEIASSAGVVVIAGAPVRLGTSLYIGAFVLGPDGDIALYTKQRLGAFPPEAACDGIVPPAEATVFSPGRRNPLVTFAGHPAAVAVCADTGRPAHPREAAVRGARTYLASMFVIPSEFARETNTLRGYAAGYAMAVAFANFGGPSGGLAAAGRSTIWSDRGEPLVQLEATGAGVAVATEEPRGWRGQATMVSR